MSYKSLLLGCFLPALAMQQGPLQIKCTAIKTSLGKLNTKHPITILGIGTKPLRPTRKDCDPENVMVQIICPFKECTQHTNSPREIWVTFLLTQGKNS
jgi:hypothetical protein